MVRALDALAAGKHVQALHRAYVGAGAKGAPLAAQQDGADLAVLLQRLRGVAERLHHLRRQRIQALRSRQRDGGERCLAFDADGHGLLLDGSLPKMWSSMAFFWVCVVPPVIVSMRTSRTMRSSGSEPK